MKVWVLLSGPYNGIIEGIFDTKEKADIMQGEKEKEYMENTGYDTYNDPHFWVEEYDVL